MSQPNEDPGLIAATERHSLFVHEAVAVQEPPVDSHEAVAVQQQPVDSPEVPAEREPTPQLTAAEPTAEPDDLDAPPPHHHPNPFLLILWALAIALIAAGLWGQATALVPVRQATGTPPTVEEYYIIPAVLHSLAPWVTAIGLGAAVAAVAVHSVQWMRRHG